MKKRMKMFGLDALITTAILLAFLISTEQYTEELYAALKVVFGVVLVPVLLGSLYYMLRPVRNICSYCSHPPHSNEKCGVQDNDYREPCQCKHTV